VIYISSQQKIVVSQYVKFGEDAWSSQEPPIDIEEVEKLATPKVDP